MYEKHAGYDWVEQYRSIEYPYWNDLSKLNISRFADNLRKVNNKIQIQYMFNVQRYHVIVQAQVQQWQEIH